MHNMKICTPEARTRLRLSILASAVLAALPLAAGAQAASTSLREVTVSADEDQTYAPATARSATKTSAPLRDVPQSVNVVTEKLIEDQNATSMEAALRNVPGVRLTSLIGTLALFYLFRGIVYVSLPLGTGPFHEWTVWIAQLLNMR